MIGYRWGEWRALSDDRDPEVFIDRQMKHKNTLCLVKGFSKVYATMYRNHTAPILGFWF